MKRGDLHVAPVLALLFVMKHPHMFHVNSP